MENAKSARSPGQVKDYDQDLRRVRQLQQMQAEQEAKAKAEELKRKKEEQLQLQQQKKDETKSGSNRPAKPIKKNNKNNQGPALSMHTFSSMPSYRPARRTIRRG